MRCLQPLWTMIFKYFLIVSLVLLFIDPIHSDIMDNSKPWRSSPSSHWHQWPISRAYHWCSSWWYTHRECYKHWYCKWNWYSLAWYVCSSLLLLCTLTQHASLRLVSKRNTLHGWHILCYPVSNPTFLLFSLPICCEPNRDILVPWSHAYQVSTITHIRNSIHIRIHIHIRKYHFSWLMNVTWMDYMEHSLFVTLTSHMQASTKMKQSFSLEIGTTSSASIFLPHSCLPKTLMEKSQPQIQVLLLCSWTFEL